MGFWGGGMGGEQQGVYVRNGFFVAPVLLLAALGSLAEISYASRTMPACLLIGKRPNCGATSFITGSGSR